MKRFFALICALVLMVCCLTACGSTKYTVSYDVDGNVTTEEVVSGEVASCKEPTAAQGKEFDGWYLDDALSQKYDPETPVTGDLTLYGTWKDIVVPVKTFTVTFMVDGTAYAIKVNEGQTAYFEDPHKDNFQFTGWYTDSACTKEFDLDTAITGDITLYAGWDEVYVPQTFIVTFALDGGMAEPAIGAQQVTEGGKVLRPANEPTREGYLFRNWYKDGEVYDFNTPVQSSFTLTAGWKLDIPATSGEAEATSSAQGHGASLALDGDTDTWWQAESEGQATLTVDLGKMNEVRSITQVFATQAQWNFVVEGSVDGTLWAEIATVNAQEEQDAFTLTTQGFFRHVRLTVLSGGVPSSEELYVRSFDLAEGTNISLGMKGNAGDWAAGNETERAFDGNYETFWCANDGSYNNKWLAVEWTYVTYVNYVDFYFQNSGTHNYEVEAKLEDDSWIKLETATDHVGQNFRLQVGREVEAILIREFSGPGWANVTEMNVYGFKDVASGLTPKTEGEYDVYDIGDSYLDSVVTASDTVEYSLDGRAWTPISAADGKAAANVEARYVRVRTGSAAKIFATPFKTDLARYVTPTASDYSDENHRPGIATMNPENVWVQSGDGVGYFWCASSWGGAHTLSIDLGVACILTGFRYTFQDDIATPNYKLKIEVSENESAWTTVFDNTETGASGKVFAGDIANVRARYIRMTVEYVDGWTNCKNVQFFGVGAPVRDIEVR